MKNSHARSLSFVGISLLLAALPLACGSDDGDGDPVGAGGDGSAGKSTTGGKTSTGGKSGGGSANQGGEPSVPNGGGGDDGAGGSGGEASAPKARLRVVHASPNAPSVDIYPKGSTEITAADVAYGTATDFIEVDAGTLGFDLRTAGAKASADPAFTTPDFELAAGADYTLVAAGDFSDPEDEDVGFRVLPLEHDFETGTAGTALARVVHATGAWDTVDFDLIDTAAVDLAGLDRFASESNVALPAAATIDVDFENADGVLSKLTLPKLTAKSELFVIATGNPGLPFRSPANGFALLVVDQAGTVTWVKEDPWLHLVHVSDIPTVDVYESTSVAAADKLANDLAAETLTAFQLPVSQAGFTLNAVGSAAANGSATALASGETSTLQAGEHYLSFIEGDAITTVREQFDLAQPTKTLLRGVQASALPATVDFGLAQAGSLQAALIAGVAPGEASAEAGVAITASGTTTLGAATTTTLTPLLADRAFTGATALAAGQRDFVLLTGGAGTAKLWVIDTAVPGWELR
jgi:hypothetical protein